MLLVLESPKRMQRKPMLPKLNNLKKNQLKEKPGIKIGRFLDIYAISFIASRIESCERETANGKHRMKNEYRILEMT